MEIEITNAAVLAYWGAVKSTVWVSEERFRHIQEHHPKDYAYYGAFIAQAIQNPYLILADHKNDRTAMFIGRTTLEGLNVIVKLAQADDPGDRSFVVTIHPVGERSLRKLRNHNAVIYEA